MDMRLGHRLSAATKGSLIALHEVGYFVGTHAQPVQCNYVQGNSNWNACRHGVGFLPSVLHSRGYGGYESGGRGRADVQSSAQNPVKLETNKQHTLNTLHGRTQIELQRSTILHPGEVRSTMDGERVLPDFGWLLQLAHGHKSTQEAQSN
jgi:hypothetical protein